MILLPSEHDNYQNMILIQYYGMNKIKGFKLLLLQHKFVKFLWFYIKQI